jgi:hypothetical protein
MKYIRQKNHQLHYVVGKVCHHFNFKFYKCLRNSLYLFFMEFFNNIIILNKFSNDIYPRSYL